MNRAILLYTEGYNGSSIQLGNKGFKIISAELPRPVSIHVLFSTIKYMTEIIHDDKRFKLGKNHFNSILFHNESIFVLGNSPPILKEYDLDFNLKTELKLKKMNMPHNIAIKDLTRYIFYRGYEKHVK